MAFAHVRGAVAVLFVASLGAASLAWSVGCPATSDEGGPGGGCGGGDSLYASLAFDNDDGDVDLGVVRIGERSAPVPLILTNTGDADTQTGALTSEVTGDFVIVESSCTASLEAGASCTVSVVFAPATLGARIGTVRVRGSGMMAPEAVTTLRGEGVAGSFTIDPSEHHFGGAYIDIPSDDVPTFTVTNELGVDSGPLTVSVTGNEFVVDTDDCSGNVLANGAACSLTMTFTPSAEGSRSATLRVDSALASATARLEGDGQGDAFLMSIAPVGQSFGTVAVGSESVALPFTVDNAGGFDSGALTVFIDGEDAGDFAIADDGCAASLVPGANCFIDVVFRPVAAGDRAATLTVQASGTTLVAALLGTAVSNEGHSLDSTAHDFGTVNVGATSDAFVFTVSNDGAAASGSLSVGLSVADEFAIEADECSGEALAPAASCAIAVHFAPTTAGNRAATLTVNDAANGFSSSAALTGTGVVAEGIDFDDNTHDFGAMLVGETSATHDFVLTNTGDGESGPFTVTIGGANPASFAIVADSCDAPLPSGASCAVTTHFAPTDPGDRVANLRAIDASSGYEAIAVLFGTGVGP